MLKWTSFVLLSGGLLSGGQEITPGKPSPDVITIKVNAAKPAIYTIPNTIFGSFLEPIGNSTYNGLWAEILQNPSFESGLWDSRAVVRMVRDEPALLRASQLAIPLPWEPLHPGQGNRYEPRRGDAANSWESLAMFGLPDQKTGVKQKVYLPVHRERSFQGSLFAKHLSGPAGIEVSIRRRNSPQDVLAKASVDAHSSTWQPYEFKLEVPQWGLAALEEADFVIQVEGDERVLIDQASLIPADAIEGMDPDMVALSKAMHTPLVRFGGNFTSGYHWRDGVGPHDKRVSMTNIAWGIPETNQFGTDEFLSYCKLIGAEPQIALNLGSGTAEEAADWVRYVNEHWDKHSGLLWELGNELWGNWNLGYPTQEQLAERTLAFSRAVKAVDPQARLIATGQDPDHYETWNAAQLKNPAGSFDLISTHFVVGTNQVGTKDKTGDATAEAAFALPVELGRKLRSMQEQIDGTAGYRGKAKIAFTEWLFNCCGGAPAPVPRYDNMGGAIAAGGFFNMLLRNADIVPVADMTGIIEFAGIWKKRGRVYATPSYYTSRMFATAEPNTALEVESDSGSYDVRGGIVRLPEIANVPYMDVVAVKNKSGNKVSIFGVNRHLTKDLPAKISLEGLKLAGRATAQELFASSIYEVNDEVRPEQIVPRETAVKVDKAGLSFLFRHESVTRIDIDVQ
jgi:alpha-N-arabinofuranosidase